jgi:threonine synthase
VSPRPTNNNDRQGVLRRYRDRLPITDSTPMLYLGEGDTPLVPARRLGERVGCQRLYFKLEMCNPTGSFKDRGMVVAVAKAVEAGSKAVLCASTGNTSAAAAAYAASCGLEAFVLVPSGNIAQGKLAQAVAHGARILALDGNFDAALRIAREISARHDVALVNSVNPHRIEGQKTAAFEVADALGDAPDYLFLPVGNAGNITAYWRGFVEYFQAEQTIRKPRIMGWQAAGAAPLVVGHPIENPETVATAIRIGNPASWKGAIAARDESGGAIDSVTDDEILEAYRLLAQEEGIFPEPVGAVSLAGLLKWARTAHPEGSKGLPEGSKGLPEVSKGLRDQTIVCVVTGHGLKDPDTALTIESKSVDVPADVAAVERAMGLE